MENNYEKCIEPPERYYIQREKISFLREKLSPLWDYPCPLLKGDVFIDVRGRQQFASVRENDMPSILAITGGIGIMGSDTFTELKRSERERLVFAAIADSDARFVLAAIRGRTVPTPPDTVMIATSYPRTARMAMYERGWPCEVRFNLGGSVEAAPYLDPTIDAIVDITMSGDTLEANGLDIVVDDLAVVKLGLVWGYGWRA